jgi:DsbC/DsbD-like thiol-disulfide interchange protein
MQIRFHAAEMTLAARRRPCAVALSVLVLLQMLSVRAAQAEPRVSAWSTDPKSSVRLIAAPSESVERPWRVGVEIHLADGALTYWRTPGGAGVAPVFSFADSMNVAKVAVRYPAPTRIEEEGTEVYGYRDDVTFPLEVTPHEAGLPMILALTLSYAVCERICLPAKATAVLDLPARPAPFQTEDAQSLAIARAEALVPRPLSQSERDTKVSIAAVEGAIPPTWRVVVRGDAARDLFAEAADGWYFETRKADVPGAFLIVQAEKPKTALDAAVPVTLTLTGSPQSYEFAAMLDRRAAER